MVFMNLSMKLNFNEEIPFYLYYTNVSNEENKSEATNVNNEICDFG
jgi:regulatory protein YycH of two-component signal transduction system YycFG